MNPDQPNADRVLELNKVGRRYGSDPAVDALVDVDLWLRRGEWVSITGPSGAGKSTLLNVLGCLDRPTSGSYLFEGVDTSQLNDKQRAGLRSRRIGFVFQSFHLLPYRTLLENVMLAEVYRKQSSRGRRVRALAAIERVGLSHRVNFLPSKLSGGERQRVAIARALVGSPSLLLCDEPTGNLDSKTSADILDLFEKLNREGLTLAVVTHDENVANRAGRRVHIIDGRVNDITNAGNETQPAITPGSSPTTASDEFFIDCGGTRPIRLGVQDDNHSRYCRHFERPFIFVGRSPDCDLQLLHAEVSFRHAYIQLVAGRLRCFDLESRKGVYWKSGAQPADWLQPNEPIRIGPYSIQAIGDDFDEMPETDELPRVAGVLKGPPPDVRLQLLNSKRTTQSAGEYRIRRNVTIIGKSRQCKIRLDGSDVSRMHCSLVLTPAGLWAVDLLGRHGTRVGDELIRHRLLKNGDELRIGQYRLGILYAQSANGSNRPVNMEEQPTSKHRCAKPKRRLGMASRRGQSTNARATDTQLAARRADTYQPATLAGASSGVSEPFVPTTVEQITTIPVSRSGITFRDLLDEALAGMFARPGRMMLTVLGVVIGLTALVATLGLTRTAGNRIISQFDQLAATELFVTARPGAAGIVDPKAIPWDAAIRLRRLNGVVAAGTMSEVDVGDALVSSSPVQDPLNQSAFKLSVHAASPELFRAVRAEMKSNGRLPDLGHSNRADRVAVLGPDAALRLGIVGVEKLPAISIGDHLYLVVGILSDVARKPELLGSVIIPEGTARHDFGLAGPSTVVVETRIGAAYLIARQAPAALRPDDPRILKLEVPQEPRRVRDEVQTDLNVMFLLLSGLSLVVGAIGIANITLVGVMERVGEIGLRRAIGATRGHIASQFLLESASMGVIGGILGASLGVLIVVAVSAYQVWTPVLDPAAPVLAPLIGGAIGLLSGTYPALRAANLEPVEAFRN